MSFPNFLKVILIVVRIEGKADIHSLDILLDVNIDLLKISKNDKFELEIYHDKSH